MMAPPRSTDEFAAILDNYEDQNFQKNVFDRTGFKEFSLLAKLGHWMTS